MNPGITEDPASNPAGQTSPSSSSLVNVLIDHLLGCPGDVFEFFPLSTGLATTHLSDSEPKLRPFKGRKLRKGRTSNVFRTRMQSSWLFSSTSLDPFFFRVVP
jgi:hypothetical protein